MTHAPACINTNQHIGSTTYYGIGGNAAFYARPRALRELAECLRWANAHSLPVGIFGSGSNALMADGTFEGLIITLAELTTSYWETEDTLYAEAGITNTELAEICLDAGRAGAAWMYRMPGQLGATIRMNARCYGGEISQIASEIFTIDMTGRLHTYSAQDVFRGYKKTLLMHTPEVVVAARIRLPHTAPREDLLNIMETCESDRHRKHHFEHPSCGSTFKNNYAVGRPSGQIFDECGLKGTRIGQSEISQFHANFVWNLGNATASDMLNLAAHMRERAQTLKQADLELEVQPIGLFPNGLIERCALDRLGPVIPQAEASWVGLHWHPAAQTEQEQLATREKVLLAAPFQDYFRTPGLGQPALSVRIVQLRPLAEAALNPNAPFLRWETHRKNADESWEQLFPFVPESPVGFVDELWNSSVSELFIANATPGATDYLEYECTPQGHWIALAFDAPRVRKSQHLHPKGELWPDFHFEKHELSFSVNFSYSRLAPFVHKGELLVQPCLSLGNQRWLLAPHWSESGSPECWDTQHKPNVKPDFHQPRRFWRVAFD